MWNTIVSYYKELGLALNGQSKDWGGFVVDTLIALCVIGLLITIPMLIARYADEKGKVYYDHWLTGYLIALSLGVVVFLLASMVSARMNLFTDKVVSAWMP